MLWFGWGGDCCFALTFSHNLALKNPTAFLCNSNQVCSTVEVFFPVFPISEVIIFEGLDEMASVLFSYAYYSKIIDGKAEVNWVSDMLP